LKYLPFPITSSLMNNQVTDNDVVATVVLTFRHANRGNTNYIPSENLLLEESISNKKNFLHPHLPAHELAERNRLLSLCGLRIYRVNGHNVTNANNFMEAVQKISEHQLYQNNDFFVVHLTLKNDMNTDDFNKRMSLSVLDAYTGRLMARVGQHEQSASGGEVLHFLDVESMKAYGQHNGCPICGNTFQTFKALPAATSILTQTAVAGATSMLCWANGFGTFFEMDETGRGLVGSAIIEGERYDTTEVYNALQLSQDVLDNSRVEPLKHMFMELFSVQFESTNGIDDTYAPRHQFILNEPVYTDFIRVFGKNEKMYGLGVLEEKNIRNRNATYIELNERYRRGILFAPYPLTPTERQGVSFGARAFFLAAPLFEKGWSLVEVVSLCAVKFDVIWFNSMKQFESVSPEVV
jgi:hypothetical protein